MTTFILFLLILGIEFNANSQSSDTYFPLPFTNDFEGTPANFGVKNENQINRWMRSDAPSLFNNCMHVSYNLSAYSYYGTTSISHAYIPLKFDSPEYVVLEFDWVCKGEINYDFFNVFLVPKNYEFEAGTLIESSYRIGKSQYTRETDITHEIINIPSTQISQDSMLLVFSWKNDASGTYNPPAAIDNINMYEVDCPLVTIITASPQINEANISWSIFGNPTSWNIVYGESGFDPSTSGTTIQTTENPYLLTDLSPETEYDVYIQSICSSDAMGNLSQKASFTTYPTCPIPTSVTMTNSNEYEISFEWEQMGDAMQWQILYGVTGFDPESAGFPTTSMQPSATISGLQMATDYDIYIKAKCSETDYSDYSTKLTYSTACGTFGAPYSQDFDNFPLKCTKKHQGKFNENTTFTSSSSNWIEDDFANVAGASKCLKRNNYGNNNYHWFISPEIDLGNDPSDHFHLMFDVALTDYSDSTIAQLNGMDDKFIVLISTDAGATWSQENILREWNNTGSEYVYNHLSFLKDEIRIDLDGYTGIVKFAFYAESKIGNADNDLFIDNFRIDEVGGVPKVIGINAHLTNSTEVTLGWKEEGIATSWNLKVSSTEIDPNTENGNIYDGTIVSDPTYTLTNLLASTKYRVYIKPTTGSEYTRYYFITPSECEAPKNLVYTSTGNSISVSWDDYGVEESTIKVFTSLPSSYYETGDILNDVVITENPYTITGLTPNTAYYIRIHATCNSNYYSELLTAITDCGKYEVNDYWQEGFENNSTSRECWAQEIIEGNHQWDFVTGNSNGLNAQEGSINARFESYGNDGIARIISPELEFEEDANYELSFYYSQEVYSGNANSLKVLYQLNPESEWIEIDNITEGTDGWLNATYSLNETSEQMRFAFEATDNGGRKSTIDNIEITKIIIYDVALEMEDLIASCNFSDSEHFNFRITNNGNVSIEPNTIFTYKLEWNNTLLINDGFQINQSFEPNQSFDLQSSTTVDLSEAEDGIFTSYISFENDSNHTNDTIHTRILGFEQALTFEDAINDTIIVEEYPYIINTQIDFTPNEDILEPTYLWEDNSSSSSLEITEEGWYTITTSTENCISTDSVFIAYYTSIDDKLISNFVVYPNPSTGKINIKFMENIDASLSIINTQGNIILSKKINNNTVSYQFDLSSQPAGVYFIQLIGDKVSIKEKIVLQ